MIPALFTHQKAKSKKIVKDSAVEIKSEGEYFMTSIKGRYFRRIMDERAPQLSAGSTVLL